MLPKSFSLRRFLRPEITICIPAYNAATFIDRTLRCAQGQTSARVRIVVSVDKSSDATAEVCRAFAGRDRRIEVYEHADRMGWCSNVNALLARVDTPFFFLYFHDDIILPQYCEHLRRALLDNPNAASANCDMAKLGAVEDWATGRSYEGSVAQRIVSLWCGAKRDSLLRAMVRTECIGSDFRLPSEEPNSLVTGEMLLVRMLAAGPSVHAPGTLYIRWQRKGGLLDGWSQLPYQRALDGRRADLSRVFQLIDEIFADDEERQIAKFAHATHTLGWLKGLSQRHGLPSSSASDLHPEVPLRVDFEEAKKRFGSDTSAWLKRMHSELIEAR